MKERIRLIMEYVQLSQQDFAARLNISPASLSSIFTGRTNPTNNHVMAIHRAFPDINISWLMFGEGTMLTDMSAISLDSSPDFQESEVFAKENNNTLDVNKIQSPEGADLASRGVSEVVGDARSAVSDSAAASFSNKLSILDKVDLLSRAAMRERRERKIKEIRVFYDDGTYESFSPSGK